MPRTSATRAEQCSGSPPGVPAFFLYGEPLRPPDERLVHIETIAARSRLHDWVIRSHRHRDLHQVLLIERGRVNARLDARNVELEAPAAIVVPPGTIHSFRFQPEAVGMVISFASAFAGEWNPAGSAHAFLARPMGMRLPRSVLRQTDLGALGLMMLREFGRSAVGRRQALSGLLAAFLANLGRQLPEAHPPSSNGTAPERDLVARFREHLERHFRNHAAIRDYAALLKTSETRLLRACLAVTGDSPLDLVHARLVIEAERQLRYTSMSVTQIAYYLGFEDPAYFSRFFTRRMGLSPRAFRRRDALTILESNEH